MQGVQTRSKSVRTAASWGGGQQQEYNQMRILETVVVEKGTVPRDEDV